MDKISEQWTHGEPAEVWRDENRVLCIRYTDGTIWNYLFTLTGLKWLNSAKGE